MADDLSGAFEIRFERHNKQSDIENAICAAQILVNITLNGHVDLSHRLMKLGTLFKTRYEHFGELEDIEAAILAHQRAVDLTLEGHPVTPVFLNALGSSRGSRFDRLGEAQDIEAAVFAHQRAVNLTPKDHIDKPWYLTCLGSSLVRQFSLRGELLDIEAAIRAHQRAVDLTSVSHDNKAIYLNNLGSSLASRFGHLGEVKDIEAAVRSNQQAVDLTSDNHVSKPVYLINLGSSLEFRFNRFGELQDIEAAIFAKQQAVDLTPEGDPIKPLYLIQLGSSLTSRFDDLGELQDIEEAIHANQRAVDLTPDDHADKPRFLCSLGHSFASRYDELEEIQDIGASVLAHQRAVDLTHDGHAGKPKYLSSLGSSFGRRYHHLGELKDIDAAIRASQQAVDLTHNGHASKSEYLMGLAYHLESRFHRLGNGSDLDGALSAYRLSALSVSGRPRRKLQAAMDWNLLCSSSGSSYFSLEASEQVLKLIPQVVWLGQTISRRLEIMGDVGDAVNLAAVMAISAGDMNTALEWLDEGRSILWGQILQLRTAIDHLRLEDKGLANDLERIAHALEVAANATYSQPTEKETSQSSAGEEALAHRNLALEYESCIYKIRGLEGSENFLLPKKLAELKPATKNGPVVVINIHEIRCDALIFCPSGTVEHLRLEHFDLDQAMNMRSTFLSCLRANNILRRGQRQSGETTDKISRILDRLWSLVVEPILVKLKDVLYFDSEDEVPHITWCATGVLAFLPLHAVHMSEAASSCPRRIFKDVVSSYTPSLSALLSHRESNVESPTILAASQPNATGLQSIPGTVEEIISVQKLFAPSDFQWVNQEQATLKTVLEAMEMPKIVHLACHGIQDNEDPLRSAFILPGGEKLTLEDLMSKDLKNAELAFLSACETAVGDEGRPEEAMHLAAGMLSAGFRSVVGSMWSIGDKDACIVAETFYRKLREFQMDGKEDWRRMAAHALHYAVQCLREGIGKEYYLRWMPFVHFGL